MVKQRDDSKKETALRFVASLSDRFIRSEFDRASTLLIYDRKLEKVSPEFKSFAREFAVRYPVDSGETLKDIEAFPKHVKALSDLAVELPPRKMTVLVAGGGSVGDFAGFFASVYKRGVKLVHMPTTWLAAIDSAHGGKTALNVAGVKNQIGTFYPAAKVVMVKSLLESQPEERVLDGLGELAKIALIDGGAWVSKLERSNFKGAELIWAGLKPAIEAKMKVVSSDPEEKLGLRQVLNLGHTLGHVLEAHEGVSHGEAVGQGLFFAIELSHSLNVLKDNDLNLSLSLLGRFGLMRARPSKPVSSRQLESYLLKDKKRDAAKAVTFILLKKIGKTERRSLPISQLVVEAKSQGWAK